MTESLCLYARLDSLTSFKDEASSHLRKMSVIERGELRKECCCILLIAKVVSHIFVPWAVIRSVKCVWDIFYSVSHDHESINQDVDHFITHSHSDSRVYLMCALCHYVGFGSTNSSGHPLVLCNLFELLLEVLSLFTRRLMTSGSILINCSLVMLTEMNQKAQKRCMGLVCTPHKSQTVLYSWVQLLSMIYKWKVWGLESEHSDLIKARMPHVQIRYK